MKISVKTESGWQFKILQYSDPKNHIDLEIGLESDGSESNWHISQVEYDNISKKYGAENAAVIKESVIAWGLQTNLNIVISQVISQEELKRRYLEQGWKLRVTGENSFAFDPPKK